MFDKSPLSLKYVSLLLGSLLLCFTGQAQAQDGKYQPIIVLDISGDASDDVKSELIEKSTDLLRQSVLEILATEIYGTGARFNRDIKRQGVIGVTTKVFRDYDQKMESAINGELKSTLSEISGNVKYKVHVIWADKNLKFKNSSRFVSLGNMYGMLWKLSMAMVSNLKPATSNELDLINDVMNIPVVSVQDLPNGIQDLFNQGRGIYESLREGNNKNILPLYARYSLEVSSHVVTNHFGLYFKPADLSTKLDPALPEDFLDPGYIIHQPPYYSRGALPIGRVSFDRIYSSGRNNSKPTLTISYGQMGKDVRELFSCSLNCAEQGSAGPVWIKKYAPTSTSVMRIPNNYNRSSTVLKAVKKFNEYVNFFFLMNVIAIDLSGKDGFEVMPEKSRIPMIVRTKTPLGSYKYLDVTKNKYGFDYIEKLVNSGAAKEISMLINSSVAAGDSATNKSFKTITERLQDIMEM